MDDYTLTAGELAELRAAHRTTRDKREADRINTVVLLGTGWSAEQVAEVLRFDPNTVRNHFKRYRQGGVKLLGHVAFRGSACVLEEAQVAWLDVHLQTHLYPTAKAVAQRVAEQFGVRDTESGMTALLHRLGYVYKKRAVASCKADADAKRAFLETYEALKQNKAEDDPIYFVDAVHPQHNPVIACSWIKRVESHAVRYQTRNLRMDFSVSTPVGSPEPTTGYDPQWFFNIAYQPF